MELLALLISSLLACAAFNVEGAVQYEVTNNAVGTAGGTIFDSQLGVDYSKKVLADASNFVWTIFQQSSDADRKDVQLVALWIEKNLTQANAVAVTINNEIHYNGQSIAGETGDLKRGFEGVLYHEVTHVWQWNNGAPGGLIEGIADFVRLKADYVPDNWAKPGDGNKWDEGYSVTARFLDYCDGLKSGFVAQLNAKMRDGYSDDFFVELLGKPVDQLWNDYKAYYGN